MLTGKMTQGFETLLRQLVDLRDETNGSAGAAPSQILTTFPTVLFLIRKGTIYFLDNRIVTSTDESSMACKAWGSPARR